LRRLIGRGHSLVARLAASQHGRATRSRHAKASATRRAAEIGDLGLLSGAPRAAMCIPGDRAPSVPHASIPLRRPLFGALEVRLAAKIVRESAARGTTPLQQPTRGRTLARRFRGSFCAGAAYRAAGRLWPRAGWARERYAGSNTLSERSPINEPEPSTTPHSNGFPNGSRERSIVETDRRSFLCGGGFASRIGDQYSRACSSCVWPKRCSIRVKRV